MTWRWTTGSTQYTAENWGKALHVITEPGVLQVTLLNQTSPGLRPSHSAHPGRGFKLPESSR